MKKIKVIILIITIGLFGFFRNSLAYENLNELEGRVARKATNTFYSGENTSNFYIRQPMGTIYKDTSTNFDQWYLTSQIRGNTLGGYNTSTEWPWRLWSADGKRMAIYMDLDTLQFSRSGRHPWFVMQADGTNLRAYAEGSSRCYNSKISYFDWSPVEPDTSYTLANNLCGRSGLDPNAVFKNTVSNTGGSYTSWVDILTGDNSTNMTHGMKRCITDDGKYMIVARGGGPGMRDAESRVENELFYIVQLTPNGSNVLNWLLPDIDPYWGGTASPTLNTYGHLHDQYFVGSGAPTGNYWLYFLHAGYGSNWRTRPWGTDNGRPDHVQDHTAPYSWMGDADEISANKEIQNFGGYLTPTPVDGCTSISHQDYDPSGLYMVEGDGDIWPVGPAIWELDVTPNRISSWASGAANYCAWSAWTDYPACTMNDSVGIIGRNNTTKYRTIYTHNRQPAPNYLFLGLSPDGTKVAVTTDWLKETKTFDVDSMMDIIISTARYPHPPEITSGAAIGGTVTIQFDWRLGTTPRGYTTIGWPGKGDNPPPPRETEKFRLWRSSDRTNWMPIATVDADIFSRYNFSNGTWQGNDYWTMTDRPGDGTWYYAVTSLEWSGLESRNLSNIFSINISGGTGTGSQCVNNCNYPASPGDIDDPVNSDFYKLFSPNYPELIRYYNIYAEDGSSLPTVDPTNRIASVPTTYCFGSTCSWVDWLGNTGGTTKYVVTAVDSQGNESNATYITGQRSSHKSTPATADGQYTVVWDTTGSSSDVTPPAAPTGLTVQ
jgi:hypothetical protein